MDENLKRSRGKDFARKTRQDRHRDKKKKGTAKTLVPKSNATDRSLKGDDASGNISSPDLGSEDEGTPGYARSKIVSNESYYDEQLPDPNSEPPLASLEELAASEDVKGGIFHFKDEADWESCSENINSQYFHLNLEQLSKSLASIPFYERVDLSDNQYTLEEKLKMDQKAEKNHLIYTKSLSSAKDMKGLDQMLSNLKKQKSKEAGTVSHPAEHDGDNVSTLTAQFKSFRFDLTDLLISNTPPVPAAADEMAYGEGTPKEKPKVPAQEGVEELSEWLDSILDD